MPSNGCHLSTGWMAAVNGRQVVPVFGSLLLMCHLPSGRLNMSFSHRDALLRSWSSGNSTGPHEI